MAIRPYRDADEEAVVRLIRDYLTWAEDRLEETYGIRENPTDISRIAESLGGYVPPHGLFLVAEEDGRPVGVGALRTNGDGVVEVKRMYVRPETRGRGLGSALLDELLRHARDTFQARTVRLDSCGFMTDAHRLYGSRGFAERPPYEGTEIPPHLQRFWRFFELTADR